MHSARIQREKLISHEQKVRELIDSYEVLLNNEGLSEKLKNKIRVQISDLNTSLDTIDTGIDQARKQFERANQQWKIQHNIDMAPYNIITID